MTSAGVILLTAWANICFGMPTYQDTRASYAASDAVLLDRHGDVIHELRVDPSVRKLAWVKLGDMSPALIKAVIRSEDKRFYEHHGADWKALSSALIGNVLGHTRRGASTITMQLASLIEKDLKPRNGKRSVALKWEQIKAGQELERTWTKDQVLEAYLNLVSFRGELQGIAAASRGIFDKDASGLDEAESAILAALIRSPNASPEKTGERAAALAVVLGSNIPGDHIRQLSRGRLSKHYAVRRRIDLAPQIAQRLLQDGSRSAVSTLDASLQRFTLDALRKAVVDLSGQNARDGAVLVVDNKSGDVIAYAANAGELSSESYVDGIRARRQAGSTLKPFLYGLGLEKGIITAASMIDDTPLDVPTGRGVYRPENYDKEFRGAVTARTALASSLNIPAVKMLELVGTERFVDQLRSLGFTGLLEPEHYGPSLALGSADISLWDLVNAYRTLANGGLKSGLRLVPHGKPPAQQRILSQEAAFIISNILSDREARSATFSLENPLATRYWTAVKTGTSKDMRDNWCVGYSDRYTVGVWVGNFSGAPMWNVSGVSGAAPVWLELMNHLHGGIPSSPPAAPPGVIKKQVTFVSKGPVNKGQEWFIKGTEQEVIRTALAPRLPKIIYPAPGTVIAVDPDIPADVQRVVFEVSSADPALRLVLDEAEIGSAPQVPWQPATGIHHLALVDNTGQVVDRLQFEVR